MPRRKNLKKVQDDSDEEVPQKTTAKQPEPIAAPEEPSQPEPAPTAGASALEEGRKDPTPPVNVLYCESQNSDTLLHIKARSLTIASSLLFTGGVLRIRV